MQYTMISKHFYNKKKNFYNKKNLAPDKGLERGPDNTNWPVDWTLTGQRPGKGQYTDLDRNFDLEPCHKEI